MKASVSIFALVLVFGACAPEPEPLPPFDPNADVTPGLNDKEPDTCHAANHAYLLGQPVAALSSAGITKEVRVIAPGALGTQEYNSQRINVTLDDAGTILRLSCG
jgi:hypothetical protein